MILGIGLIGLLVEVQKTVVRRRPSAHESMRLQIERAGADAQTAAVHGRHERHILAVGRDALSELEPGDEFLVTVEQLMQILELSVHKSSNPHELQLLKVAARLPNLKAQSKDPPLSIVKTNTVPAFVMVLQARGKRDFQRHA